MPDMVASILTFIVMGIAFHVLQEYSLSTISSALLYPWTFLQRFNQWLADQITSNLGIDISARKVLVGELLAMGFTFVQIAEWALAITCWVLLGIIGFAKAMGWIKTSSSATPSPDDPRPIMRLVGATGSVIICVLLITMTSLKKPENEPWSSFERLSFLGKYQYSPISISPSSVTFHASLMDNESYDFIITDNGDRDVYMIAIKFAIENNSAGDTYHLSSANLRTPITVWTCKDAKAKSVFLLTINRVSRHESINLKVSREKPTTDSLMSTKVNYFTYTPIPFSAISPSSLGQFIRPEEDLRDCHLVGGATGVAGTGV